MVYYGQLHSSYTTVNYGKTVISDQAITKIRDHYSNTVLDLDQY